MEGYHVENNVIDLDFDWRRNLIASIGHDLAYVFRLYASKTRRLFPVDSNWKD